jgi:uncharacterized protein YjbJ (UPF0337 family)
MAERAAPTFHERIRGYPSPRNLDREEGTVEGHMDEYKGRAKEAAGDLTDNEELQREGKADQASGKLKQAFEDIKDKANEFVDRGRGKDR